VVINRAFNDMKHITHRKSLFAVFDTLINILNMLRLLALIDYSFVPKLIHNCGAVSTLEWNKRGIILAAI
jgi:hypothetical protein